MAGELELIKAMSVLTVQHGDVVVMKADRVFTLEQRTYVEEFFSSKLGVPVVLLDNGVDIGVIRQAA
jgi:hypothetical protein